MRTLTPPTKGEILVKVEAFGVGFPFPPYSHVNGELGLVESETKLRSKRYNGNSYRHAQRTAELIRCASPIILGHEISGQVAAVEDDASGVEDDRIGEHGMGVMTVNLIIAAD